MQQSAEMATREDSATTVILTVTELKTPTMDWSVSDMHKEFPALKVLAKVWLETKGVPDS